MQIGQKDLSLYDCKCILVLVSNYYKPIEWVLWSDFRCKVIKVCYWTKVHKLCTTQFEYSYFQHHFCGTSTTLTSSSTWNPVTYHTSRTMKLKKKKFIYFLWWWFWRKWHNGCSFIRWMKNDNVLRWFIHWKVSFYMHIGTYVKILCTCECVWGLWNWWLVTYTFDRWTCRHSARIFTITPLNSRKSSEIFIHT